MSGREEQDGDERDPSPDVAVLDHGHDVRVGDGDEGYETEDGGCDGDKVKPVEGTFDGWVWTRGKVSGQPAVDGFCVLGSTYVSSTMPIVSISIGTYPAVKSKRTGELSALLFGPVVGGKKSRTGACWSISCSFRLA